MTAARVTAPFLALTALLASGCASRGLQSFELDPLGQVEVPLPSGWSARAVEENGLTIYRIEPGSGGALLLQISPVFPKEGVSTMAFVGDLAEQIRQGLAETSVEPELRVEELAGPGCRAAYVSASDGTITRPVPGEFKYVDQGAADLGAFALTFTLLTNDRGGVERAQALEMVRLAQFIPSAGGLEWASSIAPTQPAVLSLPGRPWRLEVDLPGYKLEKLEFRDPRGARFFGSNRETGVVVSAMLEPAQPGWTAVDYRERNCTEMKKLEGPMGSRSCEVDVVRSERGDVALLEFKVKTDPAKQPEGVWTQTNRHAYLVHDGVGVHVHLSKMGFVPSDAALFDAVLDSIRIRPQ